MSNAAVAAPAAKKGGAMKKLLLFVVAPLLLVGGGVGGGMMAAGKMGGGAHAQEDPDRPKLVPKKGDHAPAVAHGGGDAEHAPNPALYKSTYYAIEQSFTSNLRDTDGFLQIAIGVSTFYDSRVIDNLKESEMPVRSAVLETLAQQEAEFINTPEGKVELRRRLKKAINDVLVRRAGFGGIDDVYFTSFIIQ